MYDLKDLGTVLGAGTTTLALDPNMDQIEGKILIFTRDKLKRNMYKAILGEEHILDIDPSAEILKEAEKKRIFFEDVFYVTKLSKIDSELKQDSALPDALSLASDNYYEVNGSVQVNHFDFEEYESEFNEAVEYYTGQKDLVKEDTMLEHEILLAASSAIEALSELDIIGEENGSSDISMQQFGRLPCGKLICFDPFYFDDADY